MTDPPTTSAAPLPFPETPAITRLATMLREHLPDLRARHQIRALGVFGSYGGNEQRPDSALDVLVEFEPGTERSLLTYVGIQIEQSELSDLPGVEVDLAQRSA